MDHAPPAHSGIRPEPGRTSAWSGPWGWRSVLLLALIGCFLADVLIGLGVLVGIALPVSPGQVLRGGLLGFGLWVMWLSPEYRRWSWLCLVLIALAAISVTVGALGWRSHQQSIIHDILFLFRSLFPLALLPLLRRAKDGSLWSTWTCLGLANWGGAILAGAVVLPPLLGLAKLTYGEFTEGSTGVIYAQNDLGVALAIALLIALHRALMRPGPIHLGVVLLICAALLGIGTRMGFFSLVLIPPAVWLIHNWGRIGARSAVGRGVMVVFTSAMLIGALTWMGRYYTSLMADAFQAERYQAVFSGENPRRLLVDAGWQAVRSRGVPENLLGEGASVFQSRVYDTYQLFTDLEIYRGVEVDWLDFLGAQGVVFTLLIHGMYVWLLWCCGRAFIIRRDLHAGLAACAVGVQLAHGTVAGHSLTTAMPAALTMMLVAIAYHRMEAVTQDEHHGI